MMRRGFKSWCERTAAEYRRTLGIPLGAALDPRALAAALGVRVAAPEELPGIPRDSLQHLTRAGADQWSAVTISQGGTRLVILNSGQSRARQASSLGHELAHIILNHSSDRVQLSDQGFLFRASFDREQEAEADWLAGCLLVPREDLLRAWWRMPETSALASHFGVSEALITWRLRMTGVRKQTRRFTPRVASTERGGRTDAHT